MMMPFGKYKGVYLEDVPLEYLKWVETNAESISLPLRESINLEIERREGDRSSIGRKTKDSPG